MIVKYCQLEVEIKDITKPILLRETNLKYRYDKPCSIDQIITQQSGSLLRGGGGGWGGWPGGGGWGGWPGGGGWGPAGWYLEYCPGGGTPARCLGWLLEYPEKCGSCGVLWRLFGDTWWVGVPYALAAGLCDGVLVAGLGLWNWYRWWTWDTVVDCSGTGAWPGNSV